MVSPLRIRAAVGSGEAAKIQLRRERVGEMDVLRAKARAEPEIREREVRAGDLLPGPCPTHSG